MATVVFSTDIENVSADLTSAQLVDITHYTTPARSALYLYAYLFKRSSDNTDTQLTLDNSAPNTVTAWTFSLPQQDGTFIGIIFGFVLWVPGVYTLGNSVYYNGSYYRVGVASTSGTPGVSVDWILIANILSEVLNLANSNVSITQTYNFSAVRAATGPLGDALASFGLSVKSGKCKDWQQASSVLIGATLISSAWTLFRSMNYSAEQDIMDYLDAQTASTL